MPKFIFYQNFLYEKREKILTKQFFSNTSKQVGENLIMPNGGGYFVTSRIFFFNWVLETALQKVMNKNLENFQHHLCP